MRSTTSTIDSAIGLTGPQPGYLVRIKSANKTFNLTTLDVESTFTPPGEPACVWSPDDVQLFGLNWNVGTARNGRMVLGEEDATAPTWWVMTILLELQDAPVDIWQCYADAPAEGIPLWHGRIASIRKADAAIECDLVLDSSTLHAPRRRVQTIVPAIYLLPPGKKVAVGAQTFTLMRKLNSG